MGLRGIVEEGELKLILF